MANDILDYSNTIIYKIFCNDESIKDIYIGHTTDFVKRKKTHMSTCNNNKNEGYNYKVYQTIRKYGGWSNWTMNIIAFYNCKNLIEAKYIEQIYYELLGGTLNSIEPSPNKKIKEKKEDYFCKNCNVNFKGIYKYNIHIKSKKHINSEKYIESSTNNQDKTSKNNTLKYDIYKYVCNVCNFNSNNKHDWNEHINRPKHFKNINNIDKTKKYICNKCNKEYKSNNGLWKHKKTCIKV